MNVFNIERAFRQKEERNWDYVYWAIDIHDTIFAGMYASDQDYDPSEQCVEVLKWISDRSDCKIILWTSSYATDAEKVIQYFNDNHGIEIDFINTNTDCGSTKLADFETKMYFNILLDDKAGFEMESDWSRIKFELQRIGHWD